jgi:chromate transport protein ChrA
MAFILGRRSLVDVQTVVIAMTFGLLSFKKVPEPVLILVAGAAGLLLFTRDGDRALH